MTRVREEYFFHERTRCRSRSVRVRVVVIEPEFAEEIAPFQPDARKFHGLIVVSRHEVCNDNERKKIEK